MVRSGAPHQLVSQKPSHVSLQTCPQTDNKVIKASGKLTGTSFIIPEVTVQVISVPFSHIFKPNMN